MFYQVAMMEKIATEQVVDAKGNIFWKTTDTTTISGATSVKEFLEQMKDYYETCSCLKSLDYT